MANGWAFRVSVVVISGLALLFAATLIMLAALERQAPDYLVGGFGTTSGALIMLLVRQLEEQQIDRAQVRRGKLPPPEEGPS